MGFNAASLNPQLVERIFLGLREKSERPIVEELSSFVHDTPYISGTLPTMPSASTLARAEGSIAIGAEAKEIDTSLSSASFKIVRWPGFTQVPEHVIQDLDAQGFSALDGFAKRALAEAKANCDKDLNDLLKSTSLNKTAGAGAGWTSGGGDPFGNLDTIFNTIGDADILVLGRKQAQLLQKHPDLIAETMNFSAGSVSQSKVAEVIQRIYPHLTKVIIGGSMYNSAKEGQTAAVGFLLDDLVWAGYADDLVYVRQTGIDRTKMDYDVRRRTVLISYEEPGDIVRCNVDKGYYLSGTNA